MGPVPRPGSGPPSAHRTGAARPLGACAASRPDRHQPERNSSSAAKSTMDTRVIASSSVSNAATLAPGKAARTAVKVRSMCGWGRSCRWTVMTTPNLLPVAGCHPSLSSRPDRTRDRACFRRRVLSVYVVFGGELAAFRSVSAWLQTGSGRYGAQWMAAVDQDERRGAR
jgi:hypothetical protein